VISKLKITVGLYEIKWDRSTF